jgi:hypothetical protein
MKNTEPDKLAQDAAAAKAANMSYGKWKAMQEPVKIERNGIPDGWLICAYCGIPFKPTTKRRQFYCGAACQKQDWYEKSRKAKEGSNNG